MNIKLSWGMALVALSLASFSCAKSPEGFCEDLAADRCEVLATCCKSGSEFDVDACRIEVSRQCQSAVDVERVHAGEVEFHSGAAADCFGTIETCKDIDTIAQDESFEHTAACGSVLTGFRPPGASCSKSDQCEPAGDFATCWDGNGASSGVCAATILDEEGCSFSFENNELHVCPDGKYCDVFSFKPANGASPTSRAFEFKASCKANVAVGGKCIDDEGNGLPCATGLYCDFATGTDAKCAKKKAAGDTCTGATECAFGLNCRPVKGGPGLTCQADDDDGLFCFRPAVCGNGDCESSETMANCPDDCGNQSADCGDGVCNVNAGESLTCPDDCCGDGQCDVGETTVCPNDCAN